MSLPLTGQWPEERANLPVKADTAGNRHFFSLTVPHRLVLGASGVWRCPTETVSRDRPRRTLRGQVGGQQLRGLLTSMLLWFRHKLAPSPAPKSILNRGLGTIVPRVSLSSAGTEAGSGACPVHVWFKALPSAL